MIRAGLGKHNISKSMPLCVGCLATHQLYCSTALNKMSQLLSNKCSGTDFKRHWKMNNKTSATVTMWNAGLKLSTVMSKRKWALAVQEIHKKKNTSTTHNKVSAANQWTRHNSSNECANNAVAENMVLQKYTAAWDQNCFNFCSSTYFKDHIMDTFDSLQDFF